MYEEDNWEDHEVYHDGNVEHEVVTKGVVVFYKAGQVGVLFNMSVIKIQR